VSPIRDRISVIDIAEFSTLDYKVIAQLDLPYTLISRVFSIYPIKRYISRVSRLIKPSNTLIVSPIKDRLKIALE
jgi:predicted transcriptional regulator with HTH domain